MTEKRRGLGRGLSALIPTAESVSTVERPRDVFFGDGQADAGRRPAPSDGGHDTPEPAVTDRPLPAGSSFDRVVTSSAFTPGGLGAESVASSPSGDADAGGVGTDGTPDLPTATATAETGVSRETEGLREVPGASVADLPLDLIRPNAKQPRTEFDEDDLAELADSIRLIGVLQPIVVRPLAEPDEDGVQYELVMGERRWRASRRAGQETVPAIIRTTDDDAMLRDALLENLHRAQLNPVEEAAAYQQLLTDFGCTHEELASRIGRSRPQITNTIRLLRLPPLVSRRVAAGVLTAGHARALLGLDDPAAIERLAQRIVAEGLSVRTVEELVALGETGRPEKERARRAATPQPELDALAAQLSDRFDTRVKIAMGARRGKLTVEFATVEDLDRILAAMGSDDER